MGSGGARVMQGVGALAVLAVVFAGCSQQLSAVLTSRGADDASREAPTDASACPSGETLVYSSPGCGTAAVGRCGPTPTCSEREPYCDCSGRTTAACGESATPFAARGACMDGGVGDAGRSPEEVLCSALATRAQCGEDASCSERDKCIHARNMEPGAVAAFASCMGYPTCGDAVFCDGAASTTFAKKDASDFVAACGAKHLGCGDVFDRDLCSSVPYAYTGAAALANACLAKACAEMGPCLAAVGLYITRGCPP